MTTNLMTTVVAASLLSLAIVGLVACSSGDESATGTSTNSESRAARAHRMVDEGATLLDVRTPGEFAGGHVDGAVNIPLQTLAARMSEIPSDHAVVVYCQSGGRSARAAGELTSSGYDVFDLGGMSNW